MHGWAYAWLYMLSQTLKLTAHMQYLPPATKLRQGNVFISVCDSVHGGGGLFPGGLYLGGSIQGGLCLRVSVQGVSVRETTPVRLCAGGMHSFLSHFSITFFRKMILLCEFSVYFELKCNTQ